VGTKENFSTLWKIMFETLFTAKPYIFDRTTYQTFMGALKEELGGGGEVGLLLLFEISLR